MSKRKTIEVSTLKAKINHMLTLDTLTQEYKSALCMLLENVLHDTGNYNGFNYLNWLNGEPKDNSKYLGLEYNRVYY
jgi:hypothetical protein